MIPRSDVLQAVAANPDRSAKQIADMLGAKAVDVVSVLNAARADGEVVRLVPHKDAVARWRRR